MCVVSVTMFEIMKFNPLKSIIGCQKKQKPWSEFHFQPNFCFYNVYYRIVIVKRWYILFYFTLTEKIFILLEVLRKTSMIWCRMPKRYIHVWVLYIEHVEKLLTYRVPQVRVLWNSLTLLNWVNCCVGYEKS